MERLVTDMTETEILFDLLEKGISPAHAVSACEKRLTDAGFEVVDYGTAWNLKAGGKYVINHHETTLFAFTLPQNWSDREPANPHCSSTYRFPMLKDQTVLRYSDKRIRTGECGSLRRRNLKYMARPSTRCSRKSCSAQWGCVYTESGHVPV